MMNGLDPGGLSRSLAIRYRSSGTLGTCAVMRARRRFRGLASFCSVCSVLCAAILPPAWPSVVSQIESPRSAVDFLRLRRQDLSIHDIRRRLAEEGNPLSVGTIQKLLSEAGLSRLPRRRPDQMPAVARAPTADRNALDLAPRQLRTAFAGLNVSSGVPRRATLTECQCRVDPRRLGTVMDAWHRQVAGLDISSGCGGPSTSTSTPSRITVTRRWSRSTMSRNAPARQKGVLAFLVRNAGTRSFAWANARPSPGTRRTTRSCGSSRHG